MRRLLPPTLLVAVLAVLALVAAACGDDGGIPVEAGGDPSTSTTTSIPSTTEPATPSSAAPPTTEAATATSVPASTTTIEPDFPADDLPQGPLPDLLIANGTQVDQVQFTVARDVKAGPILTTQYPVIDLRQASDGSIFTQEFREESETEGFHEVRHYVDGEATLIEGADQLFDVAVVKGVESVIVALEPDDEFVFGGITALSVDDPSVVVAEFGLAAEAEFFPGTADFAGGILAVSAYADLTEWIGFVTPSGEELDVPSPTDDIPYNEPPLVVAATLSSDGSEVYWAEGPDWGWIEEEGQSGPIPGEWILRGADLATGEERLYWPTGTVVQDTAELAVDSMHDLGSHLVANRTTLVGTRSEPLGAWILDFTVEEPELWELPIPGIAVPAAVF